jgi:stress response protein SCP2
MAIPISNDIVMGLHWTAVPECQRSRSAPVDLDAICVLLDTSKRRLEVIRPGHLTSANGSVVHTGDSRNGASAWDDERIFVFVDALPSCVHSLVFAVVSHSRRFFEVPGASCHLSESWMEDELLRVQLTSLGRLTEYCVATLQRSASGWIMRQSAPCGASLAEVLSLPRSRFDATEAYRSKAAASACAAGQAGVLFCEC